MSHLTEGWWADFGRLVDLTVPANGVAILLAAYFDASERDGGMFGVGGFAFGYGRTKKAARGWHSLWGDMPCHMTDLHTRKKGSAFEDWTPEQAGQRLKDSVKIINRYASYGVAVSCYLPEIRALVPRSSAKDSKHLLDGFSSAYATCCHVAMFSLGKLLREKEKDSPVAYFFETGDKNQVEAARFWDVAAASPLKKFYRHYSHTRISKQNCRLLEMADIFAWEWAKHRERTAEGRGMRGSLAALLGEGHSGPTDFASDTHRALHLTGRPLERYFDKVKALILS